VAMAASRSSRRAGARLVETATAIDRAVATEFGLDRFVAAVLAELDLASGQLRCSVSGHLPPLLPRNGRVVKTLVGKSLPPLGMSGSVVVSEEMLEPADQVLFFTDGVVEARSADGEFLGVDRLVDMITRTSAAATRAPETMLRPFTPSSTTRRANCRTTSPSWWSSGAARAAVHGDKPSGVTQLRCGPVVSQRYVPSRHRVGLRRYHIVDVPSRQRLGVGSRSPPTRPLATSAAAGCGDDWRQGRREAGHGSR
jgi:hypothetical protein